MLVWGRMWPLSCCPKVRERAHLYQLSLPVEVRNISDQIKVVEAPLRPRLLLGPIPSTYSLHVDLSTEVYRRYGGSQTSYFYRLKRKKRSTCLCCQPYTFSWLDRITGGWELVTTWVLKVVKTSQHMPHMLSI